MAEKTNDTTTASNVSEQRPIGEVHAELIAEAEKQAKFNADQHAIQVEQANRFQNSASSVPAPIAPDDARAEALAAQKALADTTAADTSSNAKSVKSTTKPAPVTTPQN